MADGAGPLSILAIGGSRRPDNNTDKALRIAVEELEAGGAEVEWVRVGELRLLLPGEEGDRGDAERLQEKVRAADGILIATPEYHGSISSTLKLVIDNLGFPTTLEEKTIAILGVAMGDDGARRALGHLRQILTYIGGRVLPVEASVASVHKKFDEAGRCLDPGDKKAIRAVARGLLEHLSGRSG